MSEEFYIDQFLRQAVAAGASDIHISEGQPPAIRVAGQMRRIDMPPISSDDMDMTVRTIAPAHLQDRISRFCDLDFSYEITNFARFRVNMNRHMGKIAFVMRIIPYGIKTFEELYLPETLENFAQFNNGLILITGPTGSGKSTTIAALLEYININYAKHIVTIEDPVEFIFTNKKSVFSQRQLVVDTPTFKDGIKYAMRQDPDVIFIGEIRDRDTMIAAMDSAETGHLVVSTIHTNNAVQTVDRIINMFDAGERQFIRNQLAAILRGSISQKLVPTIDGSRLPATEVLLVTPAIKDYIERDELDNVYNLVRKGSFDNMITMNMALFNLLTNEKITKETALAYSDNKSELEQLLRGVYHGTR